MSTAILDRPQESSDGYTSSVPLRVHPDAPTRRGPARRPATRRSSVVLPVPRPSVGCVGPVGGEPQEHGYRMGRWARLAVTLSVLAAGMILLFGGHTGTGSGTTDIVTTGGQTVWSIARDAAGPGAPVQAVGDLVDSIRAGNGLEAVAADEILPTGLVLHLPVG